MKIGFIYNGLPNRYCGGSDLVAYSIIKYLKNQNIDIVCIPTKIFSYDKIVFNDLKEINVEYKIIKQKMINSRNRLMNRYLIRILLLLFFSAKRFYKIFQINELKKTIEFAVQDEDFDILIIFDNENIAASKNLQIKKVGIYGDPINLVFLSRIMHNKKRKYMVYLYEYIRHYFYYNRYLKWLAIQSKEYNLTFSFSSYEVELLKRNGARNCHLLKAPVLDLSENVKANNYSEKKFKKITLVGDLGRNYEAVHYINEFLIPAIFKEKLDDSIRIEILGSIPDKIPSEIKEIIENKIILTPGYSKFVEHDLVNTDLFLYPPDHPVGIRTKIIVAASLNCMVATHKSSVLGIPELIDGQNALVCDNYFEMTQKIINYFKKSDYEINKYKIGSRKLYEENYHPSRAIKPLLDFIRD